ncbi:GGDEF domain-containing protein [bacterium]|nr:GGDEF domain-containing protein [bacterium]
MTDHAKEPEQEFKCDDTESTAINEKSLYRHRTGPETFRPVLICLGGPAKGQRKSLHKPQIVIGRSTSVDWALNDPTASRMHTKIEYENYDKPTEMPCCYIEDLGSRNGTEVNGRQIDARIQLEEHDRLLIGSSLIGFFVRDEGELRHDESLYESATRDVLTGLDNRRQLLAHMKHHLARTGRLGIQLSFLLLDLDHFKEVNDQHGHDVGDEALCHVANILKQGCRESDLVARWGGEEFAICLPDTGNDEALTLAERLRKSVASSELGVGSKTLRFTISIGGASYRKGDDSISIFQRADRMLYKAKNAGRNCVEFNDETVDLKP